MVHVSSVAQRVMPFGQLDHMILLVVGQFSNWVAMKSQLLQLGQLAQLLHITELADLVGMQVQHLQLGEPGHLLLDAAELAL